MLLAAISFADPVMLAGLAAAGIPVALHLLNRIRSPIVMFPTLRFLKITAQKTSRRRQVQQYLLLLVRMAVFAMIAMAISRPLIRGGSSRLAYGFVVMFLAGMVMLVMAGIWGGEAVRRKSEVSGQKSEGGGENAIGKGEAVRHGSEYRPVAPGAEVAPRTGAGRYWGMASVAGVLAVLMAGWAGFGLMSDRYFSGDKGEFTGRATAAVIVLDNSHSMLAREDAATRLGRAKEQVRQILTETVRPVEAAILVTNPAGASDVGEDQLTGDMTRLVGYLDKVGAAGRARPMKERIKTAAEMLEGSAQGSKMLIVVSDFARSAFEDAEVFAAVKELPGGKDLQVVLMPMGKGSAPADVGISKFGVAEGGGVPVVGSEIIFEAEVVNNGDAAEMKELSFLVDDAVVEGVRPRVQLGPAGTGSARATIKVPYQLTQAGAHRFALKLMDVKDAMGWDDERQLALDVAEQVKVLVVGPEDRVRARSAGYYFLTALQPFGGAGGGQKGEAWSIVPTYRGAGAVKDYASVAGYAAVFVCDVPRVSGEMADALARYVKEGGRVVWVLGASVDGAEYNDVLLGNGRELLPGVLSQPMISAAGLTVDWVDLQSALFGNLFDNQEPFRSVVVTGRWGFSGGVLARGRALGKLADGNIILAQSTIGAGGAGGAGEIYTVMTSPSAAWSNLGATVLLVPMASRMAMGDSGRFKLETSYDPGERLLIRVPGAEQSGKGMAGVALDVTTPTKAVLNTRAVMSGDVPRWYFDRTTAEGVYRWRASDGKHAGMFVVNPPGEEVDLLATDVDGLAREVGTNRGTIVAGSAVELLGMLEKRSEGTSLAPGVIGMVMMLSVIEALMANRGRTGG